MRRGAVTALSMLLCVLSGILLGLIFPRGLLPWDNSWTEKITTTSTPVTAVATQSVAVQTDVEDPTTLNSRDNVPLLEAASAVVLALKEEDFNALSQWVDPQRGLTFTPYSSVNFDLDLNFTASQIAGMATDTTVYNWGIYDGSGAPLTLSFADYYKSFVYDADYAQATQLAVDKVLISGNSLENVTEAYPDCRFVEFSYPTRDPDFAGLDWCSLKLVFAPGETDWMLVAIIHGQWTT